MKVGAVRFHPWSVRGAEHSLSVSWGFRWRGVIRVFQLGWGWDTEHPLRPWPWLTRTPTPQGNLGFCLSWCGGFTAYRWRIAGR